MQKTKDTTALPGSFDIHGKTIARAYTLNTMYADGKIEVEDVEGTRYRISVDEILKLMQKEIFRADKKRTYYHLTLSN